VQLLTIDGLLSHKQREHRDYLPDLNFKKAKTEASGAEDVTLKSSGDFKIGVGKIITSVF